MNSCFLIMLITQLANLNHAIIDFSLLPKQIVDYANKLHGQRKRQFLVCRSILAQLLKQHYSVDILPEMVIGDNSRPRFLDCSFPDFNISHSGDWVAVAVALSGKVGVDIEVDRPRKNYLNVAKHCFADEEYQWMINQEDILLAFWQLWTLKESALKLYAKGVWQIKSVNVNLERHSICAPFGQHFYFHYQQLSGVHLAVNCDNPITNIVVKS